MTRRSCRKTLYYNVQNQPTVQHPSVNTPEFRSADPMRAVVFLEVPTNRLFRTATFVLLLSLLLQPVWLQAETDAVSEIAAVEISTEQVVHEPEAEVPTPPPEDLVMKEVEVATETEPEQPVSEETPLEISDPQTESAPVSDTGPGDIATSSDVEVEEPETDTTASSTLSGTSTATTGTTTENSSTAEGASSTQATMTDTTASSTTTTTVTTTDNSHDSGATDTSGSDGAAANETASTSTTRDSTNSDLATSTTASTTGAVVTVATSQSDYSFNKAECTLVEDGSYYCQKANKQPTQHDDLFAAPDVDGDMEIFVRRAGEQVQITDNVVDDASPYFDPRSNTIVWHRLINDRYQIVVYDVTTGVEQVITETRVNDMEPTRSGEYIVWQRWVDTNWEIILYDGINEVQLTDSIEHDIAPSIRGDLVIWNVRSSDGRHSLLTYDIPSGIFNTINDPDGVSVSNPRMVVVYDAVFENGDSVTRGYDLVTGELIPLTQAPAEIPTELPEPEPTGETKALVHVTPSKPEQDESDGDPDVVPNQPPKLPDTSTSTTLDLGSATTTDSVVDETVVDLVFDLDLRTTTTTETVHQHIDDLIIEPSSTSTQDQ